MASGTVPFINVDVLLAQAQAATAAMAAARTAAVEGHLQRVLAAFRAERLGPHHFASVSGYGHADSGRDSLDRVYARVMGAEAA
ncbi:MAG: aluminum resistance family protein, partial [Aphanocapsa feldmannii 288cV]